MTARRKIVPVALWRRIVAALSRSAIAVGDATGQQVAVYRRDRVKGASAFDAVIWQQAVELQADIVRRNGPGTLGELLHDVCVGLSPYQRQEITGARLGEQRAKYAREVAGKAEALARQLRELAAVADILAVCVELRAEDHDDSQRFGDAGGAPCG